MIRLATPEDAAALSALHIASFDEGWSQADFSTWLTRAEAFAIVALREREAVAFGLALAAGDDAELLTIAVAPDERRAGWGKKIFQALDAEAGNRGLRRWVLEVAHNNLPARALYESSGFVEIASRKAYYRQKDGRADALVLARPVGNADGQVAGGHEDA